MKVSLPLDDWKVKANGFPIKVTPTQDSIVTI